MSIVALLVALALVVVLIVYAAGGMKSGLVMNTNQNLFSKLHDGSFSNSSLAYGKR
jgi:hypothetical protein